jgi:hypothetical protein
MTTDKDGSLSWWSRTNSARPSPTADSEPRATRWRRSVLIQSPNAPSAGYTAVSNSSSLRIMFSAISLRCSSDASARSKYGLRRRPPLAAGRSANVSWRLSRSSHCSKSFKRPTSSSRNGGAEPTIVAAKRASSAGHVSSR